MTLFVATDDPRHERFDEWRAGAARLRAAIVQAKERLGNPALEAVLKDGIIICECHGIRARQMHLLPIYARFPTGAFDAAAQFVEGMR